MRDSLGQCKVQFGERIKIFNILFDNYSLEEAVKILTSEGGFVIPINVDILIKLQKDYVFYRIVKSADFVLCDSQIIYFFSKLLGKPLKERVAGSDLFPALCFYNSSNSSFKVFLLGGDTQEIADEAKRKINKKVNRELVVDAYSPPFGFEKNGKECLKIIERINSSEATVVAVGVGAPKQEKWIWKYKNMLPNVKLFLALGATINMEAGFVKKAPRFISRCGLEWFYRFLQDPQRLGKRYFVNDSPFFWLALEELTGVYKNPFDEENCKDSEGGKK